MTPLCFQDSHVYHKHCHLFRNGEWIWADSAYPVQPWCVSPYKRPAADRQENKTFNFWVSHVCTCGCTMPTSIYHSR
ncbi:hypothetical protein K439DRAFT_1367925 [Ramaria rubella]|nr:hypothetical protein K439DRAFT_1367925 [Ramaria rubella]